MVRKWLVTGGCGFIGTNLVRRLAGDKDNHIRVLDNLSTGSRESLARVADYVETSDSGKAPEAGIELVVGDIRDKALVETACAGMDMVVHLAANCEVQASVAHPVWDVETNVLGTVHCLEGARKQGARFVFASSAAVAGDSAVPIREDQPCRPMSPYGVGKLAGENYCHAYFRTFGLKTVALRFGNVYGPMARSKTDVVTRFFKRALAGEVLEIYGDGAQTRDFVCVADLVEAIILAAGSDQGGEVFQIASSRATSVNEIAAKIQDLVQERTGRPVRSVHADPLPGEIRQSVADISKARRVLGYSPRYDLDAGLAMTLDYFLGPDSAVSQGA